MPHLFRYAAPLILMLLPALASAQTTVRVSVDRATIWRPGFMSVATIVDSGAELDVVGRQGDWLEVVVPAGSAQDRQIGLINVRQVTVVNGVLPTDSMRPALPAGPALPSTTAPQVPPAAPVPADTGARAFADVSYQWFLARETFKAVFDQPGGPFIGGGAEFRLPNGLFVQGAARWFRQTGERAFVFEGEVFPLGIENTVTIVPLSVTAGYRFRTPGAVPYVGGGAGAYLFKETSEFADPSEDVDERLTSYHVLAGTEFRARSWITAAVEVQFTLVPDGLTGGLADAFDERDLGGLEARFKVVFGR